MRAGLLIGSLVLGAGCSDPDGQISVDAATTHDAGIDGPPPGPSLWVKADDDPADGVTDSAHGYPGSCTACPTVVTGTIGSAYQFQQDEVTFAQMPGLAPTTGLTIAAWVRVDNTAADISAVVTKMRTGPTGPELSYGLLLIPGGGSGMRMNYYKTGLQGALGDNQVQFGGWHHIAMTWDGGTLRGYIDGVQDTAQGSSMFLSYDATTPVVIGNDGGMYPFDGMIDDLRIYPYALLADEVMALATP